MNFLSARVKSVFSIPLTDSGFQCPFINEESIFLQAIEIAEEATRNRFLKEACADQPEARNRLADLIELHFGGGNILDETKVCVYHPNESAKVPDVGNHIGPYKLLQEKAVEKGLTKELQALKQDFQVAMGHYENSKYHEAQSVADRIIQSLKDYK